MNCGGAIQFVVQCHIDSASRMVEADHAAIWSEVVAFRALPCTDLLEFVLKRLWPERPVAQVALGVEVLDGLVRDRFGIRHSAIGVANLLRTCSRCG